MQSWWYKDEIGKPHGRLLAAQSAEEVGQWVRGKGASAFVSSGLAASFVPNETRSCTSYLVVWPFLLVNIEYIVYTNETGRSEGS